MSSEKPSQSINAQPEDIRTGVTVHGARTHNLRDVSFTFLCGRLDQLERLGLGHLSLGRRTTMLSSGELQRIRLATQLISRLFGVIYVLDEPAAGLHPEDVRALLQSLRLLLEAGNSLVIVEHNLDVIAEADWLTEVGPGPGRLGGEIVYFFFIQTT